MAPNVIQRGSLYNDNFRLFFKNESGQVISPMHDIPLMSDNNGTNEFNMVVEVPRWTNAKMEISKSHPLNPIMQDVKKGKVRFVGNVFPHKGYIWNYGALPQTWEDPSFEHPGTKATGDNDPIDVCEISNIIAARGSVIQVKVLGILAMIDEGETDWKVMAINTQDPLSAAMNDIADVEKYKPGLLHATVEWFKYYKVPDGKPTNAFGYNNRFKNKQFAIEVIHETHQQWRKLIGVLDEKLSDEECAVQRMSISVNESPYLITSERAQELLDQSPEFEPEAAAVDEVKATESFFINASQLPQVEVEVAASGEDVAPAPAADNQEENEVPVENEDSVAVPVPVENGTKSEMNGDGNHVEGELNGSLGGEGDAAETQAEAGSDQGAKKLESDDQDNAESMETGGEVPAN